MMMMSGEREMERDEEEKKGEKGKRVHHRRW
jgi:hypothetical protein